MMWRVRRLSSVACGPFVFAAVSLVACSGGDTSIVDSDAGADRVDGSASVNDASTRNSCGGTTPLSFLGAAHAPGDSCGACGGGVLACAGENGLSCIGSTSCGDGAVANACGAFGVLEFNSHPAAPGQSCGACLDGTLVCDANAELTCIDASSATACADGGEIGLDAGSLDAGLPDAGFDAGPPCVIPESAFTQAAPSRPTLPPEVAPTETTWTSIDLVTNDLVYNALDGLLYASVPSADGIYGNTIAIVNPATATIVERVFVGSEPAALALSDDGQVLWIGLDGSQSIGKLDTATRALSVPFHVSPAGSITGLAALPGSDTSVIASSRGEFGSTVRVYDDGVARPASVLVTNPGAYGPPPLFATYADSMAFSSSYEGSPLERLCINEKGVFLDVVDNLSPALDPYVFLNGTLYGSDGETYDVATDTAHATTAFAIGANQIAEPVLDRVYQLPSVTSIDPITITAWSLATGEVVGTTSVTVNFLLSPASFLRWGRFGFAYRTVPFPGSNGNLTLNIGRSPLIPAAP